MGAKLSIEQEAYLEKFRECVISLLELGLKHTKLELTDISIKRMLECLRQVRALSMFMLVVFSRRWTTALQPLVANGIPTALELDKYLITFSKTPLRLPNNGSAKDVCRVMDSLAIDLKLEMMRLLALSIEHVMHARLPPEENPDDKPAGSPPATDSGTSSESVSKDHALSDNVVSNNVVSNNVAPNNVAPDNVASTNAAADNNTPANVAAGADAVSNITTNMLSNNTPNNAAHDLTNTAPDTTPVNFIDTAPVNATNDTTHNTLHETSHNTTHKTLHETSHNTTHDTTHDTTHTHHLLSRAHVLSRHNAAPLSTHKHVQKGPAQPLHAHSDESIANIHIYDYLPTNRVPYQTYSFKINNEVFNITDV